MAKKFTSVSFDMSDGNTVTFDAQRYMSAGVRAIHLNFTDVPDREPDYSSDELLRMLREKLEEEIENTL